VARLFAGALDRAPQPLDAVARALAEGGAKAVTQEMVHAGVERAAPGLEPAARRLRATAVWRVIKQAVK
jgi:hypothetical protein